MQKKIQELSDTLAGFVDQQDHLTLVLGADDGTAVTAIAALQGLDQQSASDVFIVIPDEAGPGPAYITAMAARIEGERTVINDLLKTEGKPPWPELPLLCFDPRHPERERLGALVAYVRARMPDGDHRVLWALLPTTINDRAGYAQVVGLLVPAGEIEPWMRGMRFLVRDDRAQPFLAPALKRMRAPGVLIYTPDFSPGAVEAALAEETADESLPTAQRMTGLLQLAALDYAHQRFEPAVEKYRVLLAYFQQSGAREMQAVILQGMGDVLRRIGKLLPAKEKYEQGLLLVADTQALVVTLNLVVALGDVCLELKQIDEAYGYFQLGDRIATKIINPIVKADCMEKVGICLELRQQVGPASRLWQDAGQLCRQMGYHQRLASILRRQAALFRMARMTGEMRAAEAELGSLQRKGAV